jgi:hypothetical protein
MNWRINTEGKYLSAEPFKKAAITQYYSMFMAMFVVVFLILLLACRHHCSLIGNATIISSA